MKFGSLIHTLLRCVCLATALNACARPPSVPDLVAAAELANGRGIRQAVAQTTTGRVAGRVEPDGLKIFLGIPFTKPPVGELRFEPPQPAEPWTGVYPALAFGPVFPQSYDKTEYGARHALERRFMFDNPDSDVGDAPRAGPRCSSTHRAAWSMILPVKTASFGKRMCSAAHS